MANLRCFPNPFQRLDHLGVPASTFPFDPGHSPDRRWVGARIDRSPGADGTPRTHKLDTPGDLTVAIKGKVRYVDRSPRKRVAYAFDLEAPTELPATPHYVLGFRQGSLIPVDAATAKAVGIRVFVDPKAVLAKAATTAIAEWTEAHEGEAPDVSSWPEHLKTAAGIGGGTNGGAK